MNPVCRQPLVPPVPASSCMAVQCAGECGYRWRSCATPAACGKCIIIVGTTAVLHNMSSCVLRQLGQRPTTWCHNGVTDSVCALTHATMAWNARTLVVMHLLNHTGILLTTCGIDYVDPVVTAASLGIPVEENKLCRRRLHTVWVPFETGITRGRHHGNAPVCADISPTKLMNKQRHSHCFQALVTSCQPYHPHACLVKRT